MQRIRLARLGIGHHFDAVVISGEVGASKPGHRIFDIAFEQLGQPSKSTVLMIGDSLSSDIAGGTNYGVATCWYNPHAKTAAPHHLVTHEITHLTELLAFVG